MKETNIVRSGADALTILKKGIDTVHVAVAPTLGATGKNVVYNKWSGTPIISNDGVSIGREVNPVDPAERQGAELIKQVLERQNMEAGDGTSSAEILAHAIITEGMSQLTADPKLTPMKLRREIKAATEVVLGKLKEVARPVSTQEELENVATISVESKENGKIIAQAIADAGENGVVQVEEAQQEGVTITRVEGYEFNQGPISPYMFKNLEKMETTLDNPVILMTDIPLMWNEHTQKFFDKLKNTNKKDILIICDEVHPEVVKFAVLNQIKGHHKCVIVKKPMQMNHLDDIAALVGGFYMNKESGVMNVAVEYLGTAAKVIVKKDSTIIIGGGAPEGKVEEHINALKTQIADATDDEHFKQKTQERLAKLTGGVHIIHVGGRTDAEAKYDKLKIDDSVSATKAAKAEGIVAGGGSALYHIASNLMTGDLTDGEKVVFTACMAPFKQILKNSGREEDFTTSDQSPNAGYDALNDVFVGDMFAEGIIDPVKVTRCALQNASGFAGLFLTTETLITLVEKEDNSPMSRAMV